MSNQEIAKFKNKIIREIKWKKQQARDNCANDEQLEIYDEIIKVVKSVCAKPN